MRNDNTELVLALLLIASVCNFIGTALHLVRVMGRYTMPIGEVRPFKYVYADDKRQFTKPLEEAAELFAAWQNWVQKHAMVEAERIAATLTTNVNLPKLGDAE